MSPSYTPSVNLVATKVRGEPVYEAVKPIAPDTELLVYYLPERPEELFFVRMRASLYRQTMDSILEGKPTPRRTKLEYNPIIPHDPSTVVGHYRNARLTRSFLNICHLMMPRSAGILIIIPELWKRWEYEMYSNLFMVYVRKNETSLKFHHTFLLIPCSVTFPYVSGLRDVIKNQGTYFTSDSKICEMVVEKMEVRYFICVMSFVSNLRWKCLLT